MKIDISDTADYPTNGYLSWLQSIITAFVGDMIIHNKKSYLVYISKYPILLNVLPIKEF